MFNRHQSNHFLRHKLSISLQSIKLIFKYHDNFVVLTKDCHICKLCQRVDEKKTITMKDIKCAVCAPQHPESVQWLLLSHSKPNIHISIYQYVKSHHLVKTTVTSDCPHIYVRMYLCIFIAIDRLPDCRKFLCKTFCQGGEEHTKKEEKREMLKICIFLSYFGDKTHFCSRMNQQ